MTLKNEIVQWIRQWFAANGDDCVAVIGISGGCDSTVVAGLCVEALGTDRVVGVLLPDGSQSDIEDSRRVVSELGIRSFTINIGKAHNAIVKEMKKQGIPPSSQTQMNLPPRLRMSTLYAVSQTVKGRVVNTSNLSERSIGWGTRWGDTVGDLSPLGWLTKHLVIAIGHEIESLKPISDLIDKTPSDGLTGKSDEENFGFSYDALDQYIMTGECSNPNAEETILYMFEKNVFKGKMPETFKSATLDQLYN